MFHVLGMVSDSALRALCALRMVAATCTIAVLGMVRENGLRALRARRRCDASAAAAVNDLQEPTHPPPLTKAATGETPLSHVIGILKRQLGASSTC